MSYQVLARKWRPRSFGTLVGQEHVVRALSHALETGRLHHAYLFTGTRGVGKTTIARILAKALNCETGVTAEPCGVCSACQEIDAGRFVDLLEVDAATNTRVDEMRQLLENATYAPTRGRYKVYVIDEVHMLSNSAFNAMLKTLEEPPAHIKFILATTDPQKIPVTVLSRCLQFNLKQMPESHIIEHLTRILGAESVPFEPGALRHLAKAAAGSMRDALSLLDQAIAHGAGKVEEGPVRDMLGTVGEDHLYALLDALVAADPAALVAVADGMEARSLSFDAALQALAALLTRIALAGMAPQAIADEFERRRLQPYAEALDAEFVQLAYQIAIHGRDELSLAPDEYTGFTMCLLRLAAFRPETPAPLGGPGGGGSGGAGRVRPLSDATPPSVSPNPPPAAVRLVSAPAAGVDASQTRAAPVSPEAAPRLVATPPQVPAPAVPSSRPAPPPVIEAAPVRPAAAPPPRSAKPSGPPDEEPPPPWETEPAGPLMPSDDDPPRPSAADVVPEAVARPALLPATAKSPASADEPAEVPSVAVRPAAAEAGSLRESAAAPQPLADTPSAPADTLPDVDWHALIRDLGLGGLLRELAQHCAWCGLRDGRLLLRLDPVHRSLREMPNLQERLQAELMRHFGRELRLDIEVGEVAQTPARLDQAERARRHAQAVASLECDPFVRELIERFDATLDEASVKAL